MHRIFFNIALTTIIFTVFAGCSSFPLKKTEPPIVSISSVRPLNLSFSQQKLAFKLKLFNPNPYDVPIESIDFVASLAETELASGISEQGVTLPANGHEFMIVEVIIGIDRLLGQVQLMLKSANLTLGYNIRGQVKLAQWPRKIPFVVEGEVSPPEKI